MKIDKTKIEAWFNGKDTEFPEVSDSDLTKDEVKWLEKRVFKAITRKVLARPGVFTFAEHRTLQ